MRYPTHGSVMRANRLRFWRPFQRNVVNVICAEGAVADWPLHTDETFRVLMSSAPVVVVDGRGGRAIVPPGAIHVAAPLELVAVSALSDTSAGPPLLRVLLVGAGAFPPTVPNQGQFIVDDPSLHATLSAIFNDLRGLLVDVDAERRLRMCFGQLAASLGRQAVASVSDDARVARAREYLRAHTTEFVSLDTLARVAALSKFHLVRTFHRAAGITPRAYQMQLRVARAARLIAEDTPLSYAAFDAGFADQSHLTRRFKAIFGVAPGRFARELSIPPTALARTTSARSHEAPSSAA